MKKRYLTLLLITICGVAIFAYNYWSYSCGRCNSDSLLTISFPAKILIIVNLLSLIGLVLVTLWRRDRRDPSLCACGERLHSSWLFCPCCGQARLETA